MSTLQYIISFGFLIAAILLWRREFYVMPTHPTNTYKVILVSKFLFTAGLCAVHALNSVFWLATHYPRQIEHSGTSMFVLLLVGLLVITVLCGALADSIRRKV